MKSFAIMGTALALVLGGCTAIDKMDDTATETVKVDYSAALAAALDAQPDEAKARYDARNPAETLAFLGIEPGMTVVEALPGGGWYSKILIPYLGSEGALVGAHYPDDLWANFGFPEERTKAFIARSNGWVASTAEWDVSGASVSDYKITTLSDDMAGTADAVLFIRALHNLNRFNDKGAYMDKAVNEAFTVLKSGGIVGVVQHEAPESNPDEWTDGSRGYLKKSTVISAFEAAGFELVGDSDINANAADVPGEGDIVWRLPPSFNGTEEGTPERAAMAAIGESNRMTLKFRKP